MGNTQKAITQMQLALEIAPNDPNNLGALARLYNATEDFKNAEIYYRKALKITEKSLELKYLKLEAVLNKQKNTQKQLMPLKK